VCRFCVAAGKAKHWTRRLINCLELSQAGKHHLQSFGFFPFGSINLGFLLRENLAAIFIIPSSWGSQLDGALHYQHRAASSPTCLDMGTCKILDATSGKKKAPTLSTFHCPRKHPHSIDLVVKISYGFITVLKFTRFTG
jgi:hypothetical protein